MTFRRTLVALVAGLGLLASSCGSGSSEQPVTESAQVAAAETVPDQAAPAEEASAEEDPVEEAAAEQEASLVVSTVDGGQIDFASLEGQDVVLWFWAPW